LEVSKTESVRTYQRDKDSALHLNGWENEGRLLKIRKKKKPFALEDGGSGQRLRRKGNVLLLKKLEGVLRRLSERKDTNGN